MTNTAEAEAEGLKTSPVASQGPDELPTRARNRTGAEAGNDRLRMDEQTRTAMRDMPSATASAGEKRREERLKEIKRRDERERLDAVEGFNHPRVKVARAKRA